jgi:hypothetical protein
MKTKTKTDDLRLFERFRGEYKAKETKRQVQSEALTKFVESVENSLF